jgi:hypothetical protein
MFFIEVELDKDCVHWAVTEYIEGRRNVIEEGSEAVVSDALYKVTGVVEAFAPEDLV